MTKIQKTLLCIGVFAIMFVVGMQVDFSDQVMAWHLDNLDGADGALRTQSAQIKY